MDGANERPLLPLTGLDYSPSFSNDGQWVLFTLSCRDRDDVAGLTLGRNGVATKTSYLTALTLAEGPALTAPTGYSVSLSVDGKDTPLRAGSYRGALVVKVTRS